MLPSTNQRRQVAIVTGAASGLGRAISLQLAKAGHRVMLADIAAERLQAAVAEAQAFSPLCLGQALDVRDHAAWARVVDEAESRWGRLDLLVNCAGVLTIGDFWAIPPSQAKTVVDTNLLGVIHGCQSCSQLLLSAGEPAHIINVASCAGFLTFPWSSSYNAAKAGVLAYSESLMIELADTSVSVTVAMPGFFQSPMAHAATYADEVTRKCMERVFERSDLVVERVAEAILDGWKRKRRYVLTPPKVGWMWWYKRLWPSKLMRSIQRTATRLRNRYVE